MPESLRIPLRPADFPDWDAYYWTYQFQLAHRYLVPTLAKWGVWADGLRVLDVGCGNGGASCGLAAAGAIVDAVEIDPRRLEDARARAEAGEHAVRFAVADITDPATLDGFPGPYDLVLFRDVLEHIPDRSAALRESRARLGPGGGIVVTFPPYWSAYGGHQQILPARRILGLRWAKLPFAHWLPPAWLRGLAGVDADHPDWRELLTIREAGLSLSGMTRTAEREGLHVVAAHHTLLRPSFRLRYGTPVVGAGVLAHLPLLREILVMGANVLLRPPLAGPPDRG